MIPSFSLAAVEHATGGLWPYFVVIIFGFLPTEVWRVMGVLFGKSLNEQSEVFLWVRMVSTALVTAVIAKLIVSPTGALAFVPLIGRVGALCLGLIAMFVANRSIVVGLIVGEIALVSAGFLAH